MNEYLILGLPVLWFAAPAGAALALLASWLFLISAGGKEESSKDLLAVETSVEKGLKLYISSRYKVLIASFSIVFLFLLVLTFYLKVLPMLAPFAFLLGTLLQGLCEHISMRRGFNSSIKMTEEARRTLPGGFKTAYRAAASISLLLNGTVILGIAICFLASASLLRYDALQTGLVVLGFCLGASMLSFFTRISGGIFTKSADIASDLVGKTEANIPEDDPRNPAVIVDKIGNITGRTAGMVSDLFESFSLSLAGAVMLGLYASSQRSFDDQMLFVSVPMALAGSCAVVSSLAVLMVRARAGATGKNIFWYIRGSMFTVYALAIAASYYSVKLLIPGHIGIFWSAVSGILAGIIISEISAYYTSFKYRPVQKVIHSTTSGASTVIMYGFTSGMTSSWVPGLCIIASILAAYLMPGGLEDTQMGLYGIGMASVGMLSTIGTVLTLNTFANIADNASGMAKISKLEPVVKERAHAIDEVGARSFGLTRGMPVAYTIIATVALLCTFTVETTPVTAKILSSIILGGISVLILSGMVMKSVTKTTHQMIEEIRRQFREIQGLVSGGSKPNYTACLNISNKGSRRGVILPLMLGILLPSAIALLLGVSGSIGFILGAAGTGFLLAIMMSTAGEMWSSAKRFIESGKHGGKDAPAHKAAVIADTVGDPLKDAVSPSINVFIKLMLVISVLFGGILTQYSEVILNLIKDIRF